MRIIDGNNFIHRLAVERVGFGVHPVRQLFNRLCNPPETTIIVWDGPYANKRRKEIYPKYKATRRPKEESKIEFFNMAKGIVHFTPVIQVEIVGWESDDIIGTFVKRFHGDHDITVESNDGDFWQLSTKCHLPLVSKKWHFHTEDSCLLFKSLVGEAKDNVTGVKGFGMKSWEMMPENTRQKLVYQIKRQDYQAFAEIYDEFPPAVRKKYNIKELWDEINLCWKLNSFWDVPTEEIDANMRVGKVNFAAAEIYMENFLI